MRILIISHTEHYSSSNGEIRGWGPTIREVDYLAEKYGKVVHVACLKKNEAPPMSAASYSSKNVEFISIPDFGGAGVVNKLKIFLSSPRIISTVFKELRKADVFQFRAPTSMGMYLIPLLTWFTKKPGWFKYAGNWNQQNMPFSYRFQKVFLSDYQKRPVTVNGKWDYQKDHIHTFENPSISEEELEVGAKAISAKNYAAPFVGCFVGRLESAKGVDRILENLSLFSQKGIKTIHFVGEGVNIENYKQTAQNSDVECIFYGGLDKKDISAIYAQSHFLLLPSTASEGFPKVISEGANFGCIPIVSNISSIPHYINPSNGFLWDVETESFSDFVSKVKFSGDLKAQALEASKIAPLFTFRSYADKLDVTVFDKADLLNK